MTEATKKAIEVLEDMESNYRNSAHFIPEYAKHADALDHVLTLIRETDEMLSEATVIEFDEHEIHMHKGKVAAFTEGSSTGEYHPSIFAAYRSLKGLEGGE